MSNEISNNASDIKMIHVTEVFNYNHNTQSIYVVTVHVAYIHTHCVVINTI
jgi:hypothetical protein